MKKSEVVGFYHENGLVPAWNLAKMFAGEGGRIATLPDIIEAKLNSKPGNIAWENWFTTNTAEYYGLGKDGKKKIIVAHGIGPMSTLEGALKAYSHEYKDKNRNNRGGRILQQEFWDLEANKYGSVEVLDFDDIIEDFNLGEIEYPFLETLNLKQCLINRLLKARLGPKAELYLRLHAKYSSEWLKSKQSKTINNPYIVKMGDANNCGYMYYEPEEGLAFAHLICIGGIMNLIHSGHSSLITEIDCHEWFNGTKFIGIKKDTIVNSIDKCINSNSLLRQNWKELMIPNENPPLPRNLIRIMPFCDEFFTMYLKKGSCMESGDPEFRIISKEPIGDPVDFVTTIGGYELFFRYDLKEIKTIAPPESNTYLFTDKPIEIIDNGKKHLAQIQFYRAEIDYSHRLMRSSQLANDYDKMIELIDK